jgi:hypothetical protein
VRLNPTVIFSVEFYIISIIDEQFVVKDIIGYTIRHRSSDTNDVGTPLYLVCYGGYPLEASTWEEASSLNCVMLISMYHARCSSIQNSTNADIVPNLMLVISSLTFSTNLKAIFICARIYKSRAFVLRQFGLPGFTICSPY